MSLVISEEVLSASGLGAEELFLEVIVLLFSAGQIEFGKGQPEFN